MLNSFKHKFSSELGGRLSLCRDALGFSQSALAKQIGIEQQTYSRYEAGEIENPRSIVIFKLAQVLETSPEWIKYGAGTPPAYLGYAVSPDGKVPLIPWDLIVRWHGSYDLNNLAPKENDPNEKIQSIHQQEFLTIPNKRNNKQFALRVKGNAMVSPNAGARTFIEGDIIVIDPEIDPKAENFIVALLFPEGIPLFKKFVIDAGKRFLLSLNTQYPTIPFDDSKMQVCGVVTTCFAEL